MFSEISVALTPQFSAFVTFPTDLQKLLSENYGCTPKFKRRKSDSLAQFLRNGAGVPIAKRLRPTN